MPQFSILYARGANDSVLQWQIEVQGANYRSTSGQVGGALVTAAWTTAVGKNEGKANETSGEQQAQTEAQAKFDKKKKQNYFENRADIDSGFLEPQLAKPNKEYIDDVVWSDGPLIDDKLNGFACIITRHGAFTRANEQYHSIPHILEDYAEFFRDNPDGYVQGELFNNRYVQELNKIAELIAVTRQPKDIDAALLAESRRIVEFHWYDGYGFNGSKRETPLFMRRNSVDGMISYYGFKHVKPVIYTRCYSFGAMKERAEKYIATGGEGVIIKNPHAPYQHKRTKDLLKWKKSEDAEFRIVSDENPFKEGKGNSKGCAEAVWCELPKGIKAKRFKANVEGPKDRLRDFFNHPEKFRGKWITVRFQEYSPYNVPLIPYTDMLQRADVEGAGAINKA